MNLRQRIHLPLALLALVTAAAFAQDTKAIRLVVPFPPGGATDAIARMVAPKLAQELGQTVIVDNRTGASGQIGSAYVKSAAPDGLTYLFTTDHTIVALPVLLPGAGYDPMKDFTAVGQVARFQLALTTSASAQVTSVAGFKDLVRANAERASFGVPVVGGFPSMVGVALQTSIGLADAMPMAKGGRVRIFAVTGLKRSSVMPNVPTFEELGVPGLTIDSWYDFFAPAGLPAATAERFKLALAKALADGEIKQKITDLSIELAPTTLKQADDVLKSAARYWLNASRQPDFVRP